MKTLVIVLILASLLAASFAEQEHARERSEKDSKHERGDFNFPANLWKRMPLIQSILSLFYIIIEERKNMHLKEKDANDEGNDNNNKLFFYQLTYKYTYNNIIMLFKNLLNFYTVPIVSIFFFFFFFVQLTTTTITTRTS